MNNPIPKEHSDKFLTTENPPLSASSFSHSTITQRQRTTLASRMELLREKEIEMEELERIQDLSANLGQYLNGLGNDVHVLAQGSRGVANVVGNWDYVFETMGVMNTESGPDARNPTMVRLPIVSKSRTTEG